MPTLAQGADCTSSTALASWLLLIAASCLIPTTPLPTTQPTFKLPIPTPTHPWPHAVLSPPVVAAWPDGRRRSTYHDIKWHEAAGLLYAAGGLPCRLLLLKSHELLLYGRFHSTSPSGTRRGGCCTRQVGCAAGWVALDVREVGSSPSTVSSARDAAPARFISSTDGVIPQYLLQVRTRRWTCTLSCTLAAARSASSAHIDLLMCHFTHSHNLQARTRWWTCTQSCIIWPLFR